MSKIKKIPTEQELYTKFSQRCSLCEYAPFDILQKTLQAGVSLEIAQRVVDKLIDETFINEQRYTKAFVHDKFELSHWGKIKITAALRQKKIPSNLITKELDAIDAEAYSEVLFDILQTKNRQISTNIPQERKKKLLSFAASRGFEPHLIFDTLERLDISDE